MWVEVCLNNESYQTEWKKGQKEEEKEHKKAAIKGIIKARGFEFFIASQSSYNPFLSLGLMFLLNKLLVVCVLFLKLNQIVS